MVEHYRMASDMTGNWTRFIAISSLLVAVASAFFTYSTSPYFDAQPDQMSYWTVKSNSLTTQETPKTGTLEVHIQNESATPARNVLVVLHPLSDEPDISCNEEYNCLDGPGRSVLVKVARIPSKSTVKVVLVDAVAEYSLDIEQRQDSGFRYCGYVEEVQTDFGGVKKLYNKCEVDYSHSPEHQSAINDLKKKLRV
ncbi:MAG: hypothetical protein NXI04_28910 [Planctomycetaceae bacterium]|nr:hypothetical protein [Planctomycetaceae bacterium]